MQKAFTDCPHTYSTACILIYSVSMLLFLFSLYILVSYRCLSEWPTNSPVHLSPCFMNPVNPLLQVAHVYTLNLPMVARVKLCARASDTV